MRTAPSTAATATAALKCLVMVDALIALEPDHASLYILELYAQAPLNDVMRAASLTLPSDDEAADMYLAPMARLDDAVRRNLRVKFALGMIEGMTKVIYPPGSNTVIFVVMAIVLLIKPAGLFGQSK